MRLLLRRRQLSWCCCCRGSRRFLRLIKRVHNLQQSRKLSTLFCIRDFYQSRTPVTSRPLPRRIKHNISAFSSWRSEASAQASPNCKVKLRTKQSEGFSGQLTLLAESGKAGQPVMHGRRPQVIEHRPDGVAPAGVAFCLYNNIVQILGIPCAAVGYKALS